VTTEHAGIGLCVPVLDEREAIGPLLDRLAMALEDVPYTVCIVDDGSRDGTRELVEARALEDPRIVLLKRQKTRSGCRRGAASRAGMEWLLAHRSHAFFADVDADGANRPEELPRAMRLAAEREADVVIASKYVPGARVIGRPLTRRAGSRLYNLALRALIGHGIRDFSNSFRIYRRAAAEQLLAHTPLFDTPVYLVEMLAVWLARGARVVEMPTHYQERQSGASKVIVGDALRGVAGAVFVGLAFRAGRFR
jgi:dolichol-phosphate mannosyltransferase